MKVDQRFPGHGDADNQVMSAQGTSADNIANLLRQMPNFENMAFTQLLDIARKAVERAGGGVGEDDLDDLGF